MSVLAQASTDNAGLDKVLAVARPVFAAAIWGFYDGDPDRVLFKKWFLTVRMRDLRWLIVEIAGEDPSTGLTDSSTSNLSGLR